MGSGEKFTAFREVTRYENVPIDVDAIRGSISPIFENPGQGYHGSPNPCWHAARAVTILEMAEDGERIDILVDATGEKYTFLVLHDWEDAFEYWFPHDVAHGDRPLTSAVRNEESLREDKIGLGVSVEGVMDFDWETSTYAPSGRELNLGDLWELISAIQAECSTRVEDAE